MVYKFLFALVFVLVFLQQNYGQTSKHIAFYQYDSTKTNQRIAHWFIDTVLVQAHSLMGTPHKMGGTSKQGIDCSGLVKHSFRKVGIQLPHSANAQAFYGEMVMDLDSLQKGDLVFFKQTYRSNHYVTHVGLYVGEGMFIHASASKGVILSNLLVSNYWKPKFVFAKRLFN